MNVSVHFSSLSWPYAVPTAQILFSFSFYLFLAAFVLCCCRGLSLVAGSGVLLCRYMGFSLQWLLLLQSTGSRVCRLRQLQPLGSVAVVHRLSCPTACGVFLDQGQNQCPCIARQILNLDHQGSPTFLINLIKILYHLNVDIYF